MRMGLPGVLLAAALGTGCLVDVHHVSDPRPAFRRAREEAARVQGRPGPADSVHVLVYEADDEKLIRVSVPLWLARKVAHEADWEDDADWDEDGARVARRLKRHMRLKDLDAVRPGVLVEVEEQGGDQVMVWLK